MPDKTKLNEVEKVEITTLIDSCVTLSRLMGRGLNKKVSKIDTLSIKEGFYKKPTHL